MNTNKHQKAGKKGGLATKEKAPAHFSEIAKNMWEKRKEREAILKSFTIADLEDKAKLEELQKSLQALEN